ncbi:Glycosyl hydrolase family 99 [Reichenbachiella faecimaris]|uniref:Glycosyl hydrolase family 99 n=1 Tax=Reichenbachiella faecimaris TaxID=692418 RepID=A0A1W2G804_REIFA|nr:glycoside hydrolase family 71/99-like protein [Reichenbachiella faecimaris]SMD32773.1 Glycosyl hydrolase family 99 [Reichenbachiella faecimaris]
MNHILQLGLTLLILSSCKEDNSPELVLPSGGIEELSAKSVSKSNKMPVYLHYMPWFEAPGDFSEGWGIHWKMSTKDPNVIGDDDKRQIASHYYPLIGPYDSRDPDVINYHMLLMKYAGVDGVLINWYGVEGTNSDIHSLLESSNAIIDHTESTGMEFAVVMEDRFAESKEDTKINVTYLNSNYYNHKQYIEFDNRPLTLLFGPITFQASTTWTEILGASSANELFLPLWYNTGKVGEENAAGEYAWVYRDGVSGLTNFYNSTTALEIRGGGAYPGFNDYYVEGGWGDQIGWELEVSAQTLEETLDLATQNSDKLDFLQLITWNDFGEGTCIEPTLEFEFQFLEKIQKYTGVAYGVEELQLIYDWYLLSKNPAYSSDKEALDDLKQAFYYLVALKVDEAEKLISNYK